MSLFLSRLCLNPLFAPALKLAADPYELHCKLLDTLPCHKGNGPSTERPKTADVLFRVDATDSGPVVLIQSSTPPDWDALELAPRAMRMAPQTKPYILDLAPGQRLGFRLLCQPAFRKSGRFGVKANGKRVPGPRRACRTDEDRLLWLRRKSGQCGFYVETVGLSVVNWANTKRLQSPGGDPIESREEARRRAFGAPGDQRLGAVRFDGVLAITSPGELSSAVRGGIGPGKAFGFGLLSLGPP